MKLDREDYIWNPSLDLMLTLARRTPNGFRENSFPFGQSARDTRLLLEIARASRSPRGLTPYLKRHWRFLVEQGILVPRGQAPINVNEDFLISPELLPFVPKAEALAAAELRDRARGSLVVERGSVFLQTSSRRPLAAVPGMPPDSSFPTGRGLVWVHDTGTGMWAAYRFPPRLFRAARRVLEDPRAVSRLDETELEILMHARIVVKKGSAARRAQFAGAGLRGLRAHLARERYAVVESILPPMQVAVLRCYLRRRAENGYLNVDIRQVAGKRFFMQNDPLLQFVHRQSAGLVRRLTGEVVVPSYSYVSAYLPGAELKRHVDRPQCVWNGSLLIDQNPEVEMDQSWPIHLQTERKKTAVRLALGDALFYSGTELPHWRGKLRGGRRETLGLLHYVPYDFVGDLD